MNYNKWLESRLWEVLDGDLVLETNLRYCEALALQEKYINDMYRDPMTGKLLPGAFRVRKQVCGVAVRISKTRML